MIIGANFVWPLAITLYQRYLDDRLRQARGKAAAETAGARRLF
jgi:hypothetical protein